jgi:imidazolonepropionase
MVGNGAPRSGGARRQRADTLIIGAAELLTCRVPGDAAVGAALAHVETIRDGAVAVLGGRICAVGTTREVTAQWQSEHVIDATGSLVSPGFVDCHTHLVHGGSRHEEWERLALRQPTPLGDGIRWTIEQTAGSPSEVLRARAWSDLDVALAHGTTTLEAKSGYGRDVREELRLLRVMKELQDHPVDVVSTFFGAQVLPAAFADRRTHFVDAVVEAMPEAADLAEYCDVCLDPVGFSREECERIALAAHENGLGLRVHGDQTAPAGGARFAAQLGAASADHLDYASDEDLDALAGSGCVGVLVPGVAHHLMEVVPRGDTRRVDKAFLPGLARRMVERGVCVAVSTDYNPGTSPTLSMQTAMQLAVRIFGLSYAEAWYMATLNPAKSLGRAEHVGSLEVGKVADLVIWDVAEHGMVLNKFGTNLVKGVLKHGRVVAGTPEIGAHADRGYLLT